MASDPAGGEFIGLQLGRKLASLPQSGSIEPARRVIDELRHPLVADAVALPGGAGVVSQSVAGDLATVTAVHVIAQVERELDAQVSMQNRAAAQPIAAAAVAPATTEPKGKVMGAPLVEIKGLGQAIKDACSGISEVKASAAGLQVSTGGLKAELMDVTDQIEAARTQLKDEAATLGNSSSGSGV